MKTNHLKKKLLHISFLLIFAEMCFAQNQIINLWPEGHPNYQKTTEVETQTYDDILRIENVQNPAMEVFLPTKRYSTSKAIIICPGGGYSRLAYDLEGTDIAKWFNSKGIAAFVLKYRLPNPDLGNEGHTIPLQDAQRAIRLVRYHAKKWGISENQIGIMGFSAGGHLAATLGTHFNAIVSAISDDVDSLSARPNFMALIYPVITMQSEYTHKGSRTNLIGEKPNQELIDYYSNELHADSNIPATFIVHASDDQSVPVMNSVLFFQALEKVGVSVEMHIYPEGGHGFGLAIGQSHLQTWIERLGEWLNQLK